MEGKERIGRKTGLYPSIFGVVTMISHTVNLGISLLSTP